MCVCMTNYLFVANDFCRACVMQVEGMGHEVHPAKFDVLVREITTTLAGPNGKKKEATKSSSLSSDGDGGGGGGDDDNAE